MSPSQVGRVRLPLCEPNKGTLAQRSVAGGWGVVCKQGSLRQAIMYDSNNKSSRIGVKVTEADSSMESKLTLPSYKSIKLSIKKRCTT